MALRLLLLICLFLPLAGCKRSDVPKTPVAADRRPVLVQPDTPALPLAAPPFLSQPLDTTVIESTNEALPIWRKFAKHRPVLVIAANTPAVVPVPEALAEQVAQLLATADDAELRRCSSPDTTDPLLLPVMSLGVALDAGWFSGVVWIFPTRRPPAELDLQTFKQQLIAAQIASGDEAESFTLNNGSFSGIVRGRPFIAAPAAALPPLDRSALLHVDTDYFKALYNGEIKTPIYPLIVELLKQLQERGWTVAAATVALSNQGAGLPLQTRFVGKDLATLLQDPQMLKESIPHQWELRGNALYLENFMQKEEIRRVYREMEEEDPADPAVKFGLYQVTRQLNKPEEALDYLREAVQRDPVYAREYLDLSELALQKQRPEKAVEMLKLASAARPQDPFIRTQLARTLLNAGQREEARAVLDELAALDWSTTYYPEEGEALAGLRSLVQN